MNTDMSLDFWRTVTIATTAVGQTAFVVFYCTLPWWRTFLGRALFVKSGSFCILVDVAVAGRIWDWQYEEQTIIALYGLVAIGVWGQFAAFVRQKYADDIRDIAASKEAEGADA